MLNTSQHELREVSQKKEVQYIKRGLSMSEEVFMEPPFEAVCNVKSPMKSKNKTLLP